MGRSYSRQREQHIARLSACGFKVRRLRRAEPAGDGPRSSHLARLPGRTAVSTFFNAKQNSGLSVKLWRGERMCLIGMDVDDPEPDFVGFSIEVKGPGDADFQPLRNRLAFSYDKPIDQAVDGFRNYSSLEAPFQKFRWVHFPYEPKGGTYTYRVTEQHMPSDGALRAGPPLTVDIPLDMVIYDGFLDVGFARNFASSQAYNEKYQGNPNVIPVNADDGLKFKKVPGDVYEWLDSRLTI